MAAHIAAGPATVEKVSLSEGPRRNLYPVLTAPTETAFTDRVELVKRADRAARAYDPRIFQVQASYADNLRQVLVATSEGVLSFDRQPMARLNVSALARQNGGTPQRGHAGGGGRVDLDFFLNGKTPEHFAARGGAGSDRDAGRGGCAGGRDDGSSRPGMAGHSAARSGGARAGSGLQSQGRVGVQRAHWPAGSESAVHGDGRWDDRGPARVAERGR